METYETSGIGNLKVKKHHWKIIVFFVFLGVLGFIIFATVTDFSLTGKITGSAVGTLNSNNSFEFSAELNVPDLTIDGKYPIVEIEGKSDSYLNVGNQKFYLGDSKNYIFIKNYDGKISFDSGEISMLSGKAEKISVNGVEIMPSGNKVKISLSSEMAYDSLGIPENVYIKKLSYTSSGDLQLKEGKTVFSLDNEEISVAGYSGRLEVRRGRFVLDGYLQELKISGDSKIVVSV